MRPQTPQNNGPGVEPELLRSASRMSMQEENGESEIERVAMKRPKGSQFAPPNSPFSSPMKKKTKKVIKRPESNKNSGGKGGTADIRRFAVQGKSRLKDDFLSESDDGVENDIFSPARRTNKKRVAGKAPVKKINVRKSPWATVPLKENASEDRNGRPTDSVLDRLTIPAESHVGVPAADCRWRCAGNGCRKTWKGCTTGRVLRHAVACYKLRDDERQFASQNLASEAIGAAVEALDASARTTKEKTENGGGVTEKSSHDYFSASGRILRIRRIMSSFGSAWASFLFSSLAFLMVPRLRLCMMDLERRVPPRDGLRKPAGADRRLSRADSSC